MTKETIGTLGSLGPLLSSLPAPSAQPPVVTDSDTAEAAEARGAKIFTEAIIACLEICSLFESENELMREDAILSMAHRVKTGHAPDLDADHDCVISSVILAARSGAAKDIGDAIRCHFNLPAREDI
jgi:hypothetical protein